MKQIGILFSILILALGLACAQDTKPAMEPAVQPDAANQFITLATTTSTENSGLLSYLNPLFTKETGIDVRVVAKGTGAALESARNGDADIVMVHSLKDEEKFVADGFGLKRLPLMHNDFILVGPESDPAHVKGLTITDAFKKLADSKLPFVSRGDQSGTHIKELEIWGSVGIKPEGDWYLSIGQGMSKALIMAGEKTGYTLADRGTFLSMQDKIPLKILSEGAPILANPYSIIVVNPEKHPHVKVDQAKKYAEWLLSEKGQKAIEGFKVAGQTLFFPDNLK